MKDKHPIGSRKEVECCQTCGHPIVHKDFSAAFGPIQRRIFDLVERHGEITTEVLYAAIYGSDPNGGPGPKALHANIHELNKKLAPDGLAIRSGPGGRNAQPYRLVAEAAE